MTSFLIIVFPNFNDLGCLDQILWKGVEKTPQCYNEIKSPVLIGLSETFFLFLKWLSETLSFYNSVTPNMIKLHAS